MILRMLKMLSNTSPFILEELKNDGLWIPVKIENEILLIAGEL